MTGVQEYWRTAQARSVHVHAALLPDWASDFDSLDEELPNLLASLQFLLEHRYDLEERTLLADFLLQLSPYLQNRGLYPILLATCDALGEQAGDSLTQQIRVGLFRSRAYQFLGRWGDAAAELARVEALAQPTAAERRLVLFEAGRFLMNRGENRQGLRRLRAALALCQAENDRPLAALINAEFGAFYVNSGRPAVARPYFEEALQTAGALEDAELWLQSKLMLGVVFRRLGDYAAARTHLEDLLAQVDAERQPNMAATGLHHLAWVALNAGEERSAHEHCYACIALYKKAGDLRGLSDAYEQLGLIHLRVGELNAAERWLLESLRGRTGLGNRQGQASSLRHLATLDLVRGRWWGGGVRLGRSVWLYARVGVLTLGRLRGMARELWEWLWGERRWTL